MCPGVSHPDPPDRLSLLATSQNITPVTAAAVGGKARRRKTPAASPISSIPLQTTRHICLNPGGATTNRNILKGKPNKTAQQTNSGSSAARLVTSEQGCLEKIVVG